MILAVLSAILLGVGLSACGGDDSTDSTEATDAATTADATTVDVTATEYEFALSATPTTDTTEVNFINDGEEEHALVFAKINDGFTVEEAYELEGKKGSAVLYGDTGAKPGKESTIKIDKPIEPGNYAMLCPIPGHMELGQLEEFEIE